MSYTMKELVIVKLAEAIDRLTKAINRANQLKKIELGERMIPVPDE